LTSNARRAPREETPVETLPGGLLGLFFDQILNLLLIPNLFFLGLFLQVNLIGNQNGNQTDKNSKDFDDTRNAALSLLQVQNAVRNRSLGKVVFELRGSS
jgi:hypothetical protein